MMGYLKRRFNFLDNEEPISNKAMVSQIAMLEMKNTNLNTQLGTQE